MTFYALPPSTNPRRSKVVTTPQGPNPTRAFGYILYYDCLKVWADRFHEELRGVKISSLPEAEREKALRSILATTVYSIPMEVYRAVPGLPRLRRRIILMDGSTLTYMFVLKDDSSPEALKAKFSQEDLEKMAEVLGVGDRSCRLFLHSHTMFKIYLQAPRIDAVSCATSAPRSRSASHHSARDRAVWGPADSEEPDGPNARDPG
ncbi:hypothetical protein C8Q80DRAFT_209689 [Daedaleopsis nitida]|nr:hypothetical protein C8Q80DRAFT_209689 [Daedaleopsis nitida]